jgi:hypothetical protein
MEFDLPEDRKQQYDQLLKSVQDMEMTIGSAQYRIYKLTKMREELDVAIKSWWDEILKQLNLDPKSDFMITKDGKVQEVAREKKSSTPVPPSNVGNTVDTL